MSIEGVSVGDIPTKYMRPQTWFPANGFCIDASPADIKKLMDNCGTTNPANFGKWKQKVQSLFVRQNEYAAISLSVRSTWDMYFQARNFPRGSEVIMTAINI
jgi:hypothetical protein